MHDLLEFAAFIEAELPELLARWRERRAAESPTGPPTPAADPTLHTGGTT